MMVSDTHFQEILAQNPHDTVAQLVYADWLEEQGDRESLRRAEFLRLTVQLTTEPAPTSIAKTVNRIRQLTVGLDNEWVRAVSGASLLSLENVSHNGGVVARDLVQHQVCRGRVEEREVIHSDEQRFFTHFGGYRLIGSRYVVTSYGGVLDVRDRAIIHSENAAQLLSVEGEQVIFRVNNVMRESGVFAFDLNTRQVQQIDPPGKWGLPGVLSPDESQSIQGWGDAVHLHENGREQRLIASGFRVQLSQYSSALSLTNLPLAWLDNSRFLTQTANGVLVEVDLSGAIAPFLTLPVGDPPISRPRLERDLLGQLYYVCGKTAFLLDVVYRTHTEYRWMPLGEGFDCEYVQNKDYGRIIRYRGQEIGRVWCDPWRRATTRGRLAITCGPVGSNLGHPPGLRIWTAWSGTWITVDFPVNDVIGWIVPQPAERWLQ